MSEVTKTIGKVSIVPKDYNGSATYSRLDVIAYDGSSYMAKVDGALPTNLDSNSDWLKLAGHGAAATSSEITAAVNSYLDSNIHVATPSLLNAPAFSSNSTYSVGQYVIYTDNKVYCCKTAISSAGAWDSSKWDEVKLQTAVDSTLKVTGAAADAAKTGLMMVSPFSTTATYAVGDYVNNEGTLYRCHTAVTTAGSWTGVTNWTATHLADETSELKNAITNMILNDLITQDGNPVSILNGISTDVVSLEIGDYVPTFSADRTFDNPVTMTPFNSVLVSNSNSEKSFSIGVPNNSYAFVEIDVTNAKAIPYEFVELSGALIDQVTYNSTYHQLRYTSLKEIEDVDEKDKMICTHGKTQTSNRTFANLANGYAMVSGKTFALRNDNITSLDAWKVHLQEEYDKGTPVCFLYIPADKTVENVSVPSFTIDDGANTLYVNYGKISIKYRDDLLSKYVKKEFTAFSGNPVVINSSGSQNLLHDISVNKIVNADKEIGEQSFANPLTFSAVDALTIEVINKKNTEAYTISFPANVYGANYGARTCTLQVYEHLVLSPAVFDLLTYNSDYHQLRWANLPKAIGESSDNIDEMICTHAKTSKAHSYASIPDGTALLVSKQLAIRNDSFSSLDDWKTFLNAQYENGTPVEIIYPPKDFEPVIAGEKIDIEFKQSVLQLSANYGVVDISFYNAYSKSKFSDISCSIDTITEQDGTIVYITKIKKINSDESVNSFCVACGDIYFQSGTPVYCAPKTATEFSVLLNSPLVMNAGFFARQAGTMIPHGSIISNGRVMLNRTYENNYNEQALCIDAEGSFTYVDSDTMNANTLRQSGILQCFCGLGPIISNGAILTEKISQYPSGEGAENVIGYNNEYYFILTCSDSGTYSGITALRAAQILYEYGVVEAYMMDGGGSVSTVIYGGKINTDIDSTGERPVSDVLYLKKINAETALLMQMMT